MEIERINENTLKLSISYIDIEKRGFHRDEIWYNRERSEELFWEVMDEINEDFNPNGPLWIQVQALETGLEIIVTQASLPGFPDLNNPFAQGFEPLNNMDTFVANFKERGLFGVDEEEDEDELEVEDTTLEFVFVFKDFEDIIKLSSITLLDNVETQLYHFDNKYYLQVNFSDTEHSEVMMDNKLSLLLEFGDETKMTSAYLQEYGKKIIEANVFSHLRKYFF